MDGPSSFIHNDPKLETIQVPFKEWMAETKNPPTPWAITQQVKSMSSTSTTGRHLRIVLSEKSQSEKVTHCMTPFVWHSRNDDIIENGEQIKGLGREKREVGCGYKGWREGSCDKTPMWLWWGLHNSAHVIKLHTRTYTNTGASALVKSETPVKPIDCISVNFLVVILLHSLARCFQGYMDCSVLLLTMACKSTTISK